MKKCEECIHCFRLERYKYCDVYYCNIDDIKEGTNCAYFVKKVEK